MSDPAGVWAYVIMSPRTFYRYNMLSDAWEELTPPDTDFSGGHVDIHAYWVDGEIWILQWNAAAGRKLIVYDPSLDPLLVGGAADPWTYGKSEIGPTTSFAASAIIDGLLWAVQTDRALKRYELATDTWTGGYAALPARGPYNNRQFAAGVADAQGRFWVIAGESQQSAPFWQAITNSDFYDPDTNAWTAGPSVVNERRHLRAVLGPDGFIWVGPGDDGIGLVAPKSAFNRIDPVALTSCIPTPGGAGSGICAGFSDAETIDRALSRGYGLAFSKRDGTLFTFAGQEWNAPHVNNRTQRFGALDPAPLEGWGAITR